MSLADLALAARVSKATAQRFEAGSSTIPVTLAALRRAVEERGVILLDPGDLVPGGEGVRMRSAEVDEMTARA